MSHSPRHGAHPEGAGVRFQVWAPRAERVELVLERSAAGAATLPMVKEADGVFACFVARAAAGDLYRYRVDGRGPFPDPASRFQPEGVHGPSQVVDPRPFRWGDAGWN